MRRSAPGTAYPPEAAARRWSNSTRRNGFTAAPSVLSTLDALRRADITATTGYGPWNHAGNAPHGTWADFLADVTEDQPGSRTHGWKQLLSDSPHGDQSFSDG